MCKKAMVIAALGNGCSTSSEIADETGMSLRQASAWLSELGRWGVVIKTGRDQGPTKLGTLSPPRNMWLLKDGIE